MCGVCGCGEVDTIEQHNHSHEHGHSHDSSARHDHGARLVEVERDILSRNDAFAMKNRKRFQESSITALNLLSSPGSGKTTLLVKTLKDLDDGHRFYVIEGDQQTSVDADRIRETGAPAIQINTGKGCHLDAHMVGHACDDLSIKPGGVLCIENVGNLVCPAAFDLGESARVVVLSVTEGEDKPLKYPDMFYGADLVLLNKSDLLPYLDFDEAACLENLQKVKPGVKALFVSAKTGEGLEAWYDWLRSSYIS